MTTEAIPAPTRRAGKHVIGEIVSIELHRVKTRSNYRDFDFVNDEDDKAFLEDMRVNKQSIPALVFWCDEEKIYIVRDGNKRLAACRILGLPLKAEIGEKLSELELLTEQLRLNGHRSDGNRIERAKAYARVKELGGYKTSKDVAKVLGISDSYLSKLLAALELPEEGQKRIADGGDLDATLRMYAPKPRRAKGHGKKRPLSLGGGKTVLLSARKPVGDALAIEMLTMALNIVSASKVITEGQGCDSPGAEDLPEMPLQEVA